MDRRQAPRREEDVQMHYATLALLQAALNMAEDDQVGNYLTLRKAAENYRTAERVKEASGR